jgi:hypothetical protein
VSTFKKFMDVLFLGQEKARQCRCDMNAKEVGRRTKVCHGKFRPEFGNDRVQKGGITRCENDVINV